MLTRLRRFFVLTTVVVAPVMAGCFVARTRSANVKPAPGGTSAVVPVGAPTDSTRKVAAAADSARKVDSAKAVAVSDTSAGTKATGAPPAKDAKKDSVAKKPARKAAPTSKPCVLDFTESPPETRITYLRFDSTNATTYIGGGLVGHCQGENNRISADSAEQFQLAGVLNLFGNVKYEEPGKIRITSTHATYFTREERLFADGNVFAFQIASGSTFNGPSIEYFRPTASRPGTKLIAPGNPTAVLIEKDSSGKAGVPVRINAASMTDVGDSLLFATGNVVITREGLVGRSDSATFDKVTELARLIRNANVVNQDSARKFTLTGDTIDLYSKERQLNRVMALHNATAINSDVKIQSEKIDLRLKAQKLEHAYAYGRGRAKAKTPQQEIVADSLDIAMPDQRVSELHAVGKAVATGVPDTIKIKSDDRDLLRGDTVIAYFDSARFSGDTAQPKVHEIRALGNASSLFQVASKEGPTFPPALNYARGKTILLQFDSGLVRDVLVDSAASGLYLEPAVDSLSDSSKKKTTMRTSPAIPARRRGPGAVSAVQAAPAGRAPVAPQPSRLPNDVPIVAVPDSVFTPTALRRRYE